MRMKVQKREEEMVSESGSDQTPAKGQRVSSSSSSDLFGFYLPLINWMKQTRRRNTDENRGDILSLVKEKVCIEKTKN